ncbi:DUF3613 domain-containing protein, partial [Bacillus subtilis subsp. subtilis]
MNGYPGNEMNDNKHKRGARAGRIATLGA